MATKHWILTDVVNDVHVDSLSLAGENLSPGLEGCSINKRTLRGGLRDEVEVVEIDNGAFRFTVLPTRGMGIWKGWLGDFELGWQSPHAGPVHPKFVPITAPDGFGFVEGFDELLCRCGLLSNGPPVYDDRGVLVHPLHGRIANLPAHRVEVAVDSETGELSVTGTVEETRFLFHRLQLTTTIRTRPGEAGLRIEDRITNLSQRPGEMQLLYHVNFGRPLLEPGAQLVAPIKNLSPRDERAAEGIENWDVFGKEQADYTEQVYFCELAADQDKKTRVLLRNADSTRGVSLSFDITELPCFTIWKNTTGADDGYATGLEPGVNYPNLRSHEQQHGRVLALAPGEERRFELGLEIHRHPEEVAVAVEAVGRLAKSCQPTIHRSPQLR